MSRDWKPIEAVIADEEAYKSRGEYVHDGKFELVDFKDPSVKHKLWNEDARAKFPNLCYLFSQFETWLYEDYIKKPSVVSSCYQEVYEKMEEGIGILANSVRNQIKSGKTSIDIIEEEKQVTPTVYKWFVGELDEDFYYSEENNKRFLAYMDSFIDTELEKTLVITKGEMEDIRNCSDNPGEALEPYMDMIENLEQEIESRKKYCKDAPEQEDFER